MGAEQEIITPYKDALKILISDADRLRLEIHEGLKEQFSEHFQNDYKVGLLAFRKTEKQNTHRAIKKINVLSARPIESLGDVFKFVVRLQDIFKQTVKPDSELTSEFLSWQNEHVKTFDTLYVRLDEFADREHHFLQRKSDILYHTIGACVESLDKFNESRFRLDFHEHCISKALHLVECKDDLTSDDLEKDVEYINSYNERVKKKIDEASRNASNHVAHTVRGQDSEKKKQYKLLLRTESKQLMKDEIRLNVIQHVHSEEYQSADLQTRLKTILYAAVAENFAHELKFHQKKFIWGEICQRRNTVSATQEFRFGKELVLAMYKEENIKKNKDYFSHHYDKDSDEEARSAEKEQLQELKQQSELLDIELEEGDPEFLAWKKKNKQSIKSQNKRMTKPITNAEAGSFFVGDLLGVSGLAESLRKCSQYENADNVRIDVETLLTTTVEPDYPGLAAFKVGVISDIRKKWLAKLNRYVDRFIGEHNKNNVFELIDSIVKQISKDPNYRCERDQYKSEAQHEQALAYYELIKFAKEEIERADPYVDRSLKERLIRMMHTTKRKVQALVKKMTSHMNKNDRAAFEITGFISGGILLGMITLCVLIMWEVVVLTSLIALIITAASFMVGGGILGFIAKKIKDCVANAVEKYNDTPEYQSLDGVSLSNNALMYSELTSSSTVSPIMQPVINAGSKSLLATNHSPVILRHVVDGSEKLQNDIIKNRGPNRC